MKMIATIVHIKVSPFHDSCLGVSVFNFLSSEVKRYDTYGLLRATHS